MVRFSNTFSMGMRHFQKADLRMELLLVLLVPHFCCVRFACVALVSLLSVACVVKQTRSIFSHTFFNNKPIKKSQTGQYLQYSQYSQYSFAIFTGQHLFCSLFLIKLQAFRPSLIFKNNYFEERLQTVAFLNHFRKAE